MSRQLFFFGHGHVWKKRKGGNEITSIPKLPASLSHRSPPDSDLDDQKCGTASTNFVTMVQHAEPNKQEPLIR